MSGIERRVPTLGRIVHVCTGVRGERPTWRAAIVSLDAEDSPTAYPQAFIIPQDPYDLERQGSSWADLSPHMEFTGQGEAWEGRWRWPPMI